MSPKTRDEVLRARYECHFLGKQARRTGQKLNCAQIARDIGFSAQFVRKWVKSSGVVKDKVRKKDKFACLTRAMKRLIIRRSTNKRTLGKCNGSARSIADAIFKRHGQRVSHVTINKYRRSQGFKCYKIRDSPRLSKKNIKDRRTFARKHEHQDKEYFRQMVFTDEKLFGLTRRINHGAEYFWTKDKRRVPRNPTLRFTQKYMLQCGITCNGLLTPKWVPCGKTMNSARYLSILRRCVKEIKGRGDQNSADMTKTHLFDTDDWLWWQDGASCHTSKRSQRWLTENVPRFFAKGTLPGNSPDLNPIENFWAILSMKVYENGGFKTVKALKARVLKCCREFPKETLKKLVDSMPARVRKLARNPDKVIE